MARRRQEERAYDSTQLEFSESMQLTETEQEAHRLLQHYLQRSIPAGAVAILNRNNSADRLQAVTDLPGSGEPAYPGHRREAGLHQLADRAAEQASAARQRPAYGRPRLPHDRPA